MDVNSLLAALAAAAREQDAAWKAADEARRRAQAATQRFNELVQAVEDVAGWKPSHHPDCGFWVDQYPWECTCGASR